jgi:tetratricopeptide (TPR) repeat protein
MQTDLDFKKEVKFQQDLKVTIFRHERHKLKHQLQDVERTIISKKAQKIWWLVAATIIVLISLGYFVPRPSYTNIELYAMYFEPAQNIVHPIVRDVVQDSDETRAFVAYQKKDYARAAQLFKSVFQSNNNSEILFYEAICLMELDRIDQAIEKLETHGKYTDLVSNKTNWYLALAYVRQNDFEKAKAILTSITTKKGSYKYKEAKMLLKKL